MGSLFFRFIAGGLIVSLFAALGDILKPKSFAGLFGAAPSVGLATLALTMVAKGHEYAAIESRSMIVGAGSFVVYASITCRLLMKYEWHAGKGAFASLAVWFAVSFSLWFAFLR